MFQVIVQVLKFKHGVGGYSYGFVCVSCWSVGVLWRERYMGGGIKKNKQEKKHKYNLMGYMYLTTCI
jgi:hypothetical protein